MSTIICQGCRKTAAEAEVGRLLRCKSCNREDIPKPIGVYCSVSCQKADWRAHKAVHTKAKTHEQKRITEVAATSGVRGSSCPTTMLNSDEQVMQSEGSEALFARYAFSQEEKDVFDVAVKNGYLTAEAADRIQKMVEDGCFPEEYISALMPALKNNQMAGWFSMMG